MVVVLESPSFPGVGRIEEGERFIFIDDFIIFCDEVGDGKIRTLRIDTVDFLEVRGGDLFLVFADFYFRYDHSILLFNGDELVDTTEDRFASGCDESFTHTENIDACTLG